MLLGEEAAELDVPVIFTSWPTCSLSFAVSPVSEYVVPFLSLSVKLPLDPLRQPSTVVSPPADDCVS